ncbi:MAG: energy transducer TonB [Terriglobales bacterium]
MLATLLPLPAFSQAELTRKVKSKVNPTYPDLARRMNLRGSVKVLVVVSPDGNLRNSKVVGGNPILVNAALDALKKWKFEPSSEESTGTVEFKFQPSE